MGHKKAEFYDYISAILQAKRENKKLLCIFLDLEKAFDLMWTNGVLAQLAKFNIKSRLLALVQDFLKVSQGGGRRFQGQIP